MWRACAVYVLGVVTMCNIARSLAHALVSAALSVTALCCDHPHALKWREWSPQLSTRKGCWWWCVELHRQDRSLFVFWVSTQSFPKSVLGSEASAPGFWANGMW